MSKHAGRPGKEGFYSKIREINNMRESERDFTRNSEKYTPSIPIENPYFDRYDPDKNQFHSDMKSGLVLNTHKYGISWYKFSKVGTKTYPKDFGTQILIFLVYSAIISGISILFYAELNYFIVLWIIISIAQLASAFSSDPVPTYRLGYDDDKVYMKHYMTILKKGIDKDILPPDWESRKNIILHDEFLGHRQWNGSKSGSTFYIITANKSGISLTWGRRRWSKSIKMAHQLSDVGLYHLGRNPKLYERIYSSKMNIKGFPSNYQEIAETYDENLNYLTSRYKNELVQVPKKDITFPVIKCKDCKREKLLDKTYSDYFGTFCFECRDKRMNAYIGGSKLDVIHNTTYTYGMLIFKGLMLLTIFFSFGFWLCLITFWAMSKLFKENYHEPSLADIVFLKRGVGMSRWFWLQRKLNLNVSYTPGSSYRFMVYLWSLTGAVFFSYISYTLYELAIIQLMVIFVLILIVLLSQLGYPYIFKHNLNLLEMPEEEQIDKYNVPLIRRI